MNFTFSRVFRSSRVLSGASQRVHPISAHKHGHGVRHLLSMEGLLRCSANDVPLTPISFIERAAVVYRDRTSVVYGNLKFTWEETRNRCRRLASALTQLGISRGDVESKHLTVTNTRPLTMKDDVLVVAVSPDTKYIDAALLDCTIKGTRSSRKLVMELSKVSGKL